MAPSHGSRYNRSDSGAIRRTNAAGAIHQSPFVALNGDNSRAQFWIVREDRSALFPDLSDYHPLSFDNTQDQHFDSPTTCTGTNESIASTIAAVSAMPGARTACRCDARGALLAMHLVGLERHDEADASSASRRAVSGSVDAAGAPLDDLLPA